MLRYLHSNFGTNKINPVNYYFWSYRLKFVARFIIILVSFLSLNDSAFAALTLELTQGVSNLLPIAIVPFAGQSDSQVTNNVSNVVTNDLTNSGQFKVIDAQSLQQVPHTASEIDYEYWRTTKIDNVVVGEVKALGGDRYQVKFALVSVIKAQSNNSTTSQLLASQEFTVLGNQLRALAHHISDIIYQQLTGTRGVFSTRIAYVLVQRNPGQPAHYTLQVADMDGYNPKPLLTSNQPIMSPAWSHDGKRIAYVSFENVTPRIYIQNVINGNREVISQFPGINGAPAWSPDNTQLALALSKAQDLTNGTNPKIYVMDLATKQLRQVTHGNSIDTEPNWSVDGKTLLFTSDRGGSPQLYQVSTTGGDPHRITFRGSYNARGSFSPDGQNIVMINREQGAYNIAVQDIASGNMQILTNSGYDASPSFAPNGRVILYESNPGQRGVLGMVSIDGRVKLKLPAPVGSVQDPAWSPF